MAKAFIVSVLISSIVIATAIGTILYTQNLSSKSEITDYPSGNLEFQFVGSATYDVDTTYKIHRLVSNTEYTYWQVVGDWETLAQLENAEKISDSFAISEGKDLIISHEREIYEIEYFTNPEFGPEQYMITVTFKEEYQGNAVFVYDVNTFKMVPAVFYADCYIMKGDERIFLGNFYDFNDYEDNLIQGNQVYDKM